MNPEQQAPEQNSSYDFILQTEPEPEKKPFMQRLNKKALVIAGSIIVALLLVGLATWIDARAKATQQQIDRLVGIAQVQTEIGRVANIGIEQAENDDTRERAQAIKDAVDSSLQDTLALLKARDTVPDEEMLNATADTEVDDTLEKTVEFGQFDRSFEKIIDAQLLDYQQLLLQAQKAGNAEEQQVTQTQYEQANSMLGLVDEPQE